MNFKYIEAVIDLLHQVNQSRQPSDQICRHYFKTHPNMGARDRRAVTDLFFSIIRYGVYSNPRLHTLAYLHHIKGVAVEDFLLKTPLTEEEILCLKDSLSPVLCPPLFEASAERAFGENKDQELEALHQQASVDLRIQKMKRDQVLALLQGQGLNATRTPYSPWGIRLSKRIPRHHPLQLEGVFEIQDEGAQIACLLCNVHPGMTVLDYCAGAGGKTLAFAAQLQSGGHVIATDINPARLEETCTRVQRAGLKNVSIHAIDASFPLSDRVIVDVPCTGSGTWRRHPELKYRWDKESFQELLQTQQMILKKASPFVKKGGWLVYITCSLWMEENQDQIEKFLEENRNFKRVLLQGKEGLKIFAGPWITLTPYQHHTDGFFIAALERRS